MRDHLINVILWLAAWAVIFMACMLTVYLSK